MIIPRPQEIHRGEGIFLCTFDTTIVCGKGTEAFPAKLLRDCVKQWAGLNLHMAGGQARKGDIALELDEELREQEYCLTISPEEVRVAGGDGAGLLYGVQTLCQMVEQNGALLPAATVRDYPQIPRRGYYLDQARGRVLKLEELKRIADRLCRYKLNEFQLYVEHTYLFRDLSEMWRDTTPLTAEEIMELDDYCARRHIDLVPSLSSFGHLYMLLSTKSHEDLCELSDTASQPFSFLDRMRHHTVNVSEGKALPFIKKMLEEYMSLFRSDRFNLCADETFDLGKGKSRELAEEKGIHRIYVDYLKELCDFLVQHGKKPMFWGDVICGEPGLARELPEETICLTWGYAPEQREEESRRMAEAGIRQYLCPGVGGWNQWINLIGDSYQNIVRMCGYARKYHAEGVLNTDWGDFGHINHPAHSTVGMIYGAAFSWNGEDIPKGEMNRQISALEYRDCSGRLVELMEELAACSRFGWHDAVMYYEAAALGEPEVEFSIGKIPGNQRLSGTEIDKTGEKIQTVRLELGRTAAGMDSSRRGLMQDLDMVAEGMDLWNHVGGWLQTALTGKPPLETGETVSEEAPARGDVDFVLAAGLEKWFMAYKEVWRESGKEAELSRIAEIVLWYADLLRGRKRKNRK
ncbi:MAG: family 20 glycosylhydrolase [Lachnospiraceae bacterium]|nr:family 20 glycosylhydrolase [Lachnospiraceae bacterium]